MTKRKQNGKKNSKESFCGKEFTSSHTTEGLDITTTSITILNCDGTYTSKEDRDISTANKESGYTLGQSKTNNNNFSGTWQIVENNLPAEVENYFSSGGFKTNNYTVIKYHSNLGKDRYAYIQHEDGTPDYLGLVTFERDCYEYHTYRDEDLDMYSGN